MADTRSREGGRLTKKEKKNTSRSVEARKILVKGKGKVRGKWGS